MVHHALKTRLHLAGFLPIHRQLGDPGRPPPNRTPGLVFAFICGRFFLKCLIGVQQPAATRKALDKMFRTLSLRP